MRFKVSVLQTFDITQKMFQNQNGRLKVDETLTLKVNFETPRIPVILQMTPIDRQKYPYHQK